MSDTFETADAEGVTLGLLHHPVHGYLVLPSHAPNGPRFSPMEENAYFGTVQMLRDAARYTFGPDEWDDLEVVPLEYEDA